MLFLVYVVYFASLAIFFSFTFAYFIYSSHGFEMVWWLRVGVDVEWTRKQWLTIAPCRKELTQHLETAVFIKFASWESGLRLAPVRLAVSEVLTNSLCPACANDVSCYRPAFLLRKYRMLKRSVFSGHQASDKLPWAESWCTDCIFCLLFFW